MKVLFIGGPPEGAKAWSERWESRSQAIGRALARGGHALLVCSSYDKGADHWVLRGFAEVAPDADRIHVHAPGTPDTVEAKWSALFDDLGLGRPVHYKRVPGPPADPALGGSSLRDAYLLAQLSALEACDAVVACGGSPNGSATSTLSLAEARAIPILPYALDADTASASARVYHEQHGALANALEEHQLPLLLEDAGLQQCNILLRRLRRPSNAIDRDTYVFISHAWGRPTPTDRVEMELRRNGINIFRDERNIQPGADLPTVINRALDACTHFIGLWCNAYATSPYCYDEFHRVVERNRGAPRHARIQVLMLRFDETRLTWKALRESNSDVLHPVVDVDDRHHLRSILYRFMGIAPPPFS